MKHSGFTLVEMVVSIALVGILAAMTATFLRLPIESHLVARQRLALADGARPALHRLDQELRQALPNSVRVTQVGTTVYLEFLAVRAAGRLRAGAGGPPGLCPGGNQLQFGAADNCFTSLGSLVDGALIVPGQDWVVVNNQGPGFPLDAYLNGNGNGPNKSRVTGVLLAAPGPAPEDRIGFTNWTFPAMPASRAFQVVSGAVTWECNPALGQWRRYSGYGIRAVQPTPPPVVPAVMAAEVSGCDIRYDANAGGLMDGLVMISLDLSRPVPGDLGREAIRLFAQIPVITTP